MVRQTNNIKRSKYSGSKRFITRRGGRIRRPVSRFTISDEQIPNINVSNPPKDSKISKTRQNRQNIKWSNDELYSLKQGIARYGIGEWKAMLEDSHLSFHASRKPRDLHSKQRSLSLASFSKNTIHNIFCEGIRLLAITDIGRQPVPSGSITTSDSLVYRLLTNFAESSTLWTTAQAHHPDWNDVVNNYCNKPNVPESLKRALVRSTSSRGDRQQIFIPNPKDPLFASISQQPNVVKASSLEDTRSSPITTNHIEPIVNRICSPLINRQERIPLSNISIQPAHHQNESLLNTREVMAAELKRYRMLSRRDSSIPFYSQH